MLPPELLLRIVDYALPPPTVQTHYERRAILYPLLLVNSTFRGVAEEVLYRDAWVGTPAEGEVLAATLEQDEQKAARIKRLWVGSTQGLFGWSEPAFDRLLPLCHGVEKLWMENVSNCDLALIAGLQTPSLHRQQSSSTTLCTSFSSQ
ncbi:hypothetical protein JCM10207_001873 [Rhodosporidiobolus poonsookiae]